MQHFLHKSTSCVDGVSRARNACHSLHKSPVVCMGEVWMDGWTDMHQLVGRLTVIP